MPIGTVEDVAVVLNITRRRVNQLVKAGVLPRAARGQYDVEECQRAYALYLRRLAKAKGLVDADGKITPIHHLRAQLLAVRTERARLELAKARGEVMSIADYVARLSHLIIETKARIKAIVPRVAPQIVGETSRSVIQAKLDQAVNEALSDLAKMQFPPLLLPPAR